MEESRLEAGLWKCGGVVFPFSGGGKVPVPRHVCPRGGSPHRALGASGVRIPGPQPQTRSRWVPGPHLSWFQGNPGTECTHRLLCSGISTSEFICTAGYTHTRDSAFREDFAVSGSQQWGGQEAAPQTAGLL